MVGQQHPQVTERPLIGFRLERRRSIGRSRFGQSTRSLERDAEILVCIEASGVGRDRSDAFGLRLRVAAQTVEAVAEVVVNKVPVLVVQEFRTDCLITATGGLELSALLAQLASCEVTTCVYTKVQRARDFGLQGLQS